MTEKSSLEWLLDQEEAKPKHSGLTLDQIVAMSYPMVLKHMKASSKWDSAFLGILESKGKVSSK